MSTNQGGEILTREEIEVLKLAQAVKGDCQPFQTLCDMALASLDRPAPVGERPKAPDAKWESAEEAANALMPYTEALEAYATMLEKLYNVAGACFDDASSRLAALEKEQGK